MRRKKIIKERNNEEMLGRKEEKKDRETDGDSREIDFINIHDAQH